MSASIEGRPSARRVAAALMLLLSAAERASAQEHAAPTPANVLRRDGYYAQGEINAALFAQTDDSNSPAFIARAFGFSGRGGHRWHDKALFVSLEAQFWSSPALDSKRQIAMAINLGIGAEILSAGGLLRTSLAFGPSLLTIPTDVDSAGSLGFFVDLRPLGLRFAVGSGLLFGIDPLSFTLLMPELSGIPLVELEYRTAVYLEHAL
jgi:hypothetical protein